MQFKDAAYQVLKQASEPLHYNEITERALAVGILTTTGQTPHATMGSRLYTDTLSEDSLFRRAGKKGFFALKEKPPSDIVRQIEAINQQARQKLRQLVLEMHPQDFEELIGELLVALGVEEGSVQVTRFSGDGGIDVRGRMLANGITEINIAVQAKRWKHNVGSKVVRELRGSLKVHEQGIIITPSNYTESAITEAQESGKTRISLINGEELVELMIRHKVGAYEEKYAVIYLDEERWQEMLETPPMPAIPLATSSPAPKAIFPLQIRSEHKGEVYLAELLNLEGQVRFNGKEHATPTGAAKVFVTDWKEVNGWAMWKYLNPTSGKWEKIGNLR